jgi:hypothetical protein
MATCNRCLDAYKNALVKGRISIHSIAGFFLSNGESLVKANVAYVTVVQFFTIRKNKGCIYEKAKNGTLICDIVSDNVTHDSV